MNHDLVAAGHPALRFDLLLYNENLPKHWDTNSEVASKFNESAVRVRRVGRAVNLAAAASLSAERASAHIADRGSAPWPELADYDCFACHQSLSIREYRLPPSDQSKSPLHVSDGLPIWNAWHTINQLDLRDDRKTLEALSPHRSDPQRIAQSVPKLAAKYRQEAIGRMTEDIESRDAVKIPLTQLQTAPPVDWHQAAIQYLDLDAGLRDLARDPATAQQAIKFLQSLGDCEVMLRFDASEGSPNYDSPKAFDPDAFRDRVLSIFQVKPLQPSRSANNPNN